MRTTFALCLLISAVVLANSQPIQALPVSGAVAWFDASDIDGDGISGNNPGNGASVSSWADKASTVQGAQNAVQATGSLQPTYVVGAQNGQAAVNFDDDILVTPSLTYGTFTYFSVFRTSGPTAILYERSANENSNPGEYFVTSTGSTLAVNRGGPHTHYNLTSGWSHTGSFLTATHLFGGTHATHSMLVNGDTVTLVNQITGDPGTGSISDSLYIGARSGQAVPFDGDISELVAFGSVLNSAEVNIVNNYLSAKYDTPMVPAVNKYAGDDPGNGDYDFDVIGIGQQSDGSLSASPTGAGGGLTISEVGGTLDDGDYLLAGHDGTANSLTTADVPLGENVRMSRVWYLDRTDPNNDLETSLAFDFSDAGIDEPGKILSGSLLFSSDEGPFAFSVVGGLTTSIVGDTVTFGVPAGFLDDGYYTLAVDVQPIPEPSSLLLLGLGCVGLLVRRRRRTGRSGELATEMHEAKPEVSGRRRVASLSMRSIVAGLVALVMFTAASAVQAMTTDFYEETVLGNNPILYWRLGEPSGPTAANLGSYGASGDATYVTDGGTTFNVTGPLFGSTDTAITLPGSSVANYVNFNPSTSFPHPSTALSYEFWINAASGQGSRSVSSFSANTIDGPGTGTDNEFLLFAPDALDVWINNVAVDTGVDIATGAWHHVVVTWRSSDGQLVVYKDGTIANSLVHQVGVPINIAGVFALGQENDAAGGINFDPNQALAASYDEFAIYNSVLTLTQVQLHYDVGVGNILPPPIPEPSTMVLLAGTILLLPRVRRMRRRQ